MPDTLSLTTGVSLGLLAGIVSGVCYLVANGITWPKEEQTAGRRCLRAVKDDGVCIRCGGEQQGGYIPCICRDSKPLKFESGAWFLRQVQQAATLMPWSISTDKLEQIDEEYDGRDSPGPSSREAQNDATVREFLETLAAKLTGGTLEGTRVSPLYDHPAYLPPLRNGSQSSASSRPSSGASNAHVHLKRLVARVVEEAASLPALARYAAEPHTPTIESSTYEDLLASAILNKVIEKFQNENGSGGRSSGIHSASASPTPSERSSPRSLPSRNITHHSRDITPPLLEEDDVSDWEEGEATDEALEVPRRVPFPEFGGDIVHHNDENEERELDEVSSSDLQGVDGSWEENWLFQKKKIKTLQSVPVPMLVPNSNADYRALIGDRDADDTTDLSDNASDIEEQGGYKSDIKKVLDSKHVIGGKIKIDDESDYEPDSLTMDEGEDFEKLVENGYKNNVAVETIINEINNVTIAKTQDTIDEVDGISNGKDSVLLLGVDDGPMMKAEFNLKEEIHRSLMNGNATHYTDDQHDEVFDDSIESLANNKDSTNNTLNHHEREGEYEETVTVPVQRYADSLRRKHFEDTNHELKTETGSTNLEDELVPGSVAYRERQKWLNCVDMPNNPYSPEAIQKRLSAKSTSSLFDMITSKQDFVERNETSLDLNDDKRQEKEEENYVESRKISTSESADNIGTDRRSKSPSPKILKDVLADEVPQYKRYGRDYYIREAKASAGGRKKSSLSDTSSLSSMNKSTSLDNFDTELASPGLLIKQFNVIATNQQYTKFTGNDQIRSITTMPNNKTDILIEYEDHNDQNLYSARPVIIDDDTDEKFEEILQSAYNNTATEIAANDSEPDKNEEPIKSPISIANSYLSSSSLEDSIKIYNIQTGEIIKCRPDDSLSARYEATTDYEENTDISDKRVPGDNFDIISQNGDSTEEVVIIEESKENLENSELEDFLPQLPKVKELAKKFVSMENLSETAKIPQPYSKRRRSKENVLNDLNADRQVNKQVYMHSLTARSITKEFREGLKLSMSTPIKVPGGSKEVPDGEVIKESSRPGSPVPEPGTIKTKLAFFESLKTKFSSK